MEPCLYDQNCETFQTIENLAGLMTPERVKILANAPCDLYANIVRRLNSHSLASVPIQVEGCLGMDEEVAFLSGEYVRFFMEIGCYEMFQAYLAERSPYLDCSEREEISLLSIWTSLFEYPWSDVPSDQYPKVMGYIMTNIKRFALSRSNQTCLKHDPAMLQYIRDVSPDPGEIIDLDIAIEELLLSTFGPEMNHKKEKGRVLQMLALGFSLEEISKSMKLSRSLLQGWIERIKRHREFEPKLRVNVQIGGQWVWDSHTAEVLLSTQAVSVLMSEKEIQTLQHLKQYGSVTAAANALGVNIHRLKTHLKNIRTKVGSHGNESAQRPESQLYFRRRLCNFLGVVNPRDATDEAIQQALLRNRGDIKTSATRLGISDNAVTSFLMRYGWYAS